MSYVLVVVHAFGAHAIGDRISAETQINDVLNSEAARHVVRVAARPTAHTSQEG